MSHWENQRMYSWRRRPEPLLDGDTYTFPKHYEITQQETQMTPQEKAVIQAAKAWNKTYCGSYQNYHDNPAAGAARLTLKLALEVLETSEKRALTESVLKDINEVAKKHGVVLDGFCGLAKADGMIPPQSRLVSK